MNQPITTDYQLKNIHPEDIEDLLIKIETSFDIEFVGNELIHIKTFGELCDHIANKIVLEDSDDCTTQQAFYRLRNAVVSTLKLDKSTIVPDLPLNDLLPRSLRRSRVRSLENHLGFKLNILRSPHWLTYTLVILLVVSFIGMFFNFQIGVPTFMAAIGAFWLSNKLGIEMDLQTLGQVAEKMTRENYLKSRRNSKTFNRKEIEDVLTGWFSNEFELDKKNLTREAELFNVATK